MAEDARQTPEIDSRRVLIAGTMIAAAVVVAVAVAWSLMTAYGGQVHASHAPPGNLRPQLQSRPREDLAEYQAREQARLSTYGWVDRNAGVVRIPVERAMDLLIADPGKTSQAGEAPPP
jgi:hypothetical protein